MRRQRLYSAQIEPSLEGARALRSEPQRGALRRAQWSSYYHHFFGRVRRGDRVPGDFQPLSLDDSTRTLYAVYPPARRATARRQVARRCVSRMLHYGYRPAESRRQEFDSLAEWVAPRRGRPTGRAAELDATRGVDAARAKEALFTWAEREFSSQKPSALELAQQMEAADASMNMIALPTALDNDRGAFVVTKRVYLRASVAQVSALVNPENWEQLGEFFARTFRDGTDNDPVDAPPEPWHGVLREDFIVSWNGFATNLFKQRLKIDYSVSPQRVCTDYALMYEEDDQITLNEGFLEVRVGTADERLPPGWIVGTMRKKLKFTSSMLNLFCPALLPMLLDSKAGGFNNFVTPLPGDGRRAARDGSRAR